MYGNSSKPETSPYALVLLYGFSGLTSVAYEVLWTRMLSLQFGVSIFAVVLTVSVFMLGLGTGCLYSAKRALRYKNNLLVFATLEGGISVYALLLPVILQMMSTWVDSEAARLSLYQWYGLMGIGALCLLLIPAFAMGVGFPVVLQALRDTNLRLGHLYGLNTLGAAIGALLPLWLLPELGWSTGVRLVAVIGMTVSLIAFLLSRHSAPTATRPADDESSRPPVSLLINYAGIGAASLILEIGWTRLFGMVMLRTEYVLALILTIFLLGIGLGSLVAPRLSRQKWINILPAVACGFALFSLWLLPTFSSWVERGDYTSLLSALTVQGLALAILTMPVTLILGAWLPLLHEESNGGGLWLYGANCLGAALGAVAAGLLLIPIGGSTAAVVVAAIGLLMFGAIMSKLRTLWILVPVFLVVAWPLVKMPEVSKLLPQTQSGSKDLYRYEDAISMTQVIAQRDGQRILLTDMQRMDASTEPTAVFVQGNQARLPLLLHPHPRSVLFLGLGTGITVSGSLPFPGLRRTAVELSQGAIISAASWFSGVNNDSMNQTTVIRDDARHYLSSIHEQYDVIIGDVFHPDLAGYGSLLTVQQFQRARNRLNDGGLFVQWLALNQFDNYSLEVVLRSFHKVFPDAQLFLDGMHLALVGPKQKFSGGTGMLENLGRLSLAQQDEVTAGEGGWTWLGRYWGPITVDSGPVQDAWEPVIEFKLPRARYSGQLQTMEDVLTGLLKRRPGMQEAEKILGVDNANRKSFDLAYGASELLARSWLAAAQGSMQTSDRMIYLAYQANRKDRWIAYGLADSMFASLDQASRQGLDETAALKRILAINPRHVESLRLLWRIQRQMHDAQAQETRARILEISPLDAEAIAGGS